MTRQSETAAASGERPPHLPARIAWSLGSGTILLGLNSAIIAVAIIPMTEHFGDSTAIPWIVSSLYIAAAIGSPTSGRLSDLLGARRVYLIGLAIILLASVLGPFTPSAGWMIADRVLLGLGASVQFPAAMAVIRQQARLRRAQPTRAIGVIALCGQSTAALGPTVGGFIVLLWGWQGIFWINVPMVALCAATVVASVPRDAARDRLTARQLIRLLDPIGMLLMIASLVALMLALLSLNDADPRWWGFVLFVPLAGLFVWRELRADHPFVDVRLMGRFPQFGLTCLRAITTFISFYCVFYGLPQWLDATRGLDTATTGLLLLPVFGVGALSTVVASRLGAHWHPRVLLIVGTSAMALAGALLMTTARADSAIWWLAVVCALLGLPNGFNNLGNQLLLHRAVPAEVAGASSGIYRTSQYVGASLAAVVTAHAIAPAAAEGGISELGAAITLLSGVLLLLSVVAYVRQRLSRR